MPPCRLRSPLPSRRQAGMAGLGRLYMKGEGVPMDKRVGFNWCLKSAERGNAAAMYSVGTACFTGNGVSRDLRAAAAWWGKASALGNEQAKLSLRAWERGELIPT